jgi:hypothetical protein
MFLVIREPVLGGASLQTALEMFISVTRQASLQAAFMVEPTDKAQARQLTLAKWQKIAPKPKVTFFTDQATLLIGAPVIPGYCG